MKIEEEVKGKFRNEFHKLAVNIIFTHGWLLNNHTLIFKPFKITPNQFNILRILRGQHPNPVTVNLLKERMLDKMSDASRLVERLREKGLVERNICSKDRRRVDIKITDKGLKLLADIDKYNDKMDSHLKNLTSKEAVELNALLDKLRG